MAALRAEMATAAALAVAAEKAAADYYANVQADVVPAKPEYKGNCKCADEEKEQCGLVRVLEVGGSPAAAGAVQAMIIKHT